MSPRRIVLALPLFVALAFVPALPVMYLGETSWAAVGKVYPALIDLLSQGSITHRDIIFFLVVIAGHLGLSLGLATLVDMALFRTGD